MFQGNAFLVFVLLDVLLLLGRCLAPAWPTSRLLFQLEPCIHIVSEETLLRLCKMPDFVYAFEDVPPGSGFLEFGGTPRALELALLVGMKTFGASLK